MDSVARIVIGLDHLF